MLIPISHERHTARRWPWVSITTVVFCIAVCVVMSSEQEADSYEARRALEYFSEHPYLDLDPELSRAAWGASSKKVIRLLRSKLGTEANRDWIHAHQLELELLVEAWHQERQRNQGPRRKWGLVPAELRTVNLVSAVFVHAGVLHLLGNLFFLWFCGPALEDVWGRTLFAALFLSSGIVANLFWVFCHPDSEVPLVGASGAVAGLMGAFMVRFGASRIHMFYSFVIFEGIFSAPAWLMLGLWLGREILLSPISESGFSEVAHAAHVGGFVFGAATALAVKPLELRFLAPGIEKKLGAETNPVVGEAHDLRLMGRPEEAWELLSSELRKRPDNHDATLALWDLAIELGRLRDAAGPFHRAIRLELSQGEATLAFDHWRQLAAKLPGEPLSLDLMIHLAEALLDRGGEEEAALVLASASECLRPDVDTRLGVSWARAVCRLRNPELHWARPARRLLIQTRCRDRRLESRLLDSLGIMLWLEVRFGDSLDNHCRGMLLCESLCGVLSSPEAVDSPLDSIRWWTDPECFDKALAMYEKAEEKVDGHDASRLACLLAGKSDLLRASGRLSEAENTLRRALRLRQSDLGPGHPSVAHDLVHLGDLLLDLDRAEQALPLLERALAIFETTTEAPAYRSRARFVLAKALLALDREPDRVERLVREARG